MHIQGFKFVYRILYNLCAKDSTTISQAFTREYSFSPCRPGVLLCMKICSFIQIFHLQNITFQPKYFLITLIKSIQTHMSWRQSSNKVVISFIQLIIFKPFILSHILFHKKLKNTVFYYGFLQVSCRLNSEFY